MSNFISNLATNVWTPVLFLLILGGVFFLLYSRFVQYQYLGHAIRILRGKYNNPNDPGQINSY
ncbi:MAG: sodium/alanine symporter, partial [Cyclobacteriaceae bacterium]